LPHVESASGVVVLVPGERCRVQDKLSAALYEIAEFSIPLCGDLPGQRTKAGLDELGKKRA
jgi:hypothetical protein